MKILQQSLASILITLLAFPAWGSSNVVGSAVNSQFASVRDTALIPGSTVFSGDAISVAEKGNAQISLLGGGGVEVRDNSAVRLVRDTNAVQLILEYGAASFHSEQGSPVEALLADATIRGADGLAARGLIRFETPTSVLVSAQKGALAVVTAHNARTLIVPEGSIARVTLIPNDSPQASGPAPAGQAGPWASGKKLAIVALLLGGGAVTAGVILAHHEKSVNASNEISPFKP